MKKINLNLKGNIIHQKLWRRSGILGHTVNLCVQIHQGVNYQHYEDGNCHDALILIFYLHMTLDT